MTRDKQEDGPRVAASWRGEDGTEHRAVVGEHGIVTLEFRGTDAMGADGWRCMTYYDPQDGDVVTGALVQHFLALAGAEHGWDDERPAVPWEEARATRFLWVWYELPAGAWRAEREVTGACYELPGPKRAPVALRCCLHSRKLTVVRHPEVRAGGDLEPAEDREVLRVLLTPEYYEGAVGWTAQCLDPDVCSQGANVLSAVHELLRAVSTARYVATRDPTVQSPGPAPAELQERWEVGTPVDPPVDGVDARLAPE